MATSLEHSRGNAARHPLARQDRWERDPVRGEEQGLSHSTQESRAVLGGAAARSMTRQ